MSLSPEYADLHIHSNLSDGLLPPETIVEQAAERGLTVIAFTEHNLFVAHSLIEDLKELGSQHDLVLVEGVEVSTVYQGQSLHVLGYSEHFQPVPGLNNLLKGLQENYARRGERIIGQVNEAGYELSLADVLATGAHYPHRNAIAMAAKQKFGGKFRDWLKYTVEEDYTFPDAAEVIDLIHQSGGLAVLAHPGSSIDTSLGSLHPLVDSLQRDGLDGIEKSHIGNRGKIVASDIEYFASKGFLQTGGSDFHGEEYFPVHLGSHAMTKSEYEVFAAALHKIAKGSDR